MSGRDEGKEVLRAPALGTVAQFPAEAEECEKCGGRLGAYKTTEPRLVVSVRLGVMPVVEIQKQCEECREFVARSEALRRFVPPRERYAYDTIAFVGWRYFVDVLNVTAIQQRVKKRIQMRLPRRTVSDLLRKFVEHVRGVHDSRADRIRAAFARLGGFVVHMDGTWDGNTEVLVLGVGRAGRHTWVLAAEKLVTEHENGVAKLAGRIRRDFGVWLAAMRDLSSGITNGLEQAAEGVRQFDCQAHFARVVGKKLLQPRRKELADDLREADLTRRLSEIQKYARRVLKEQAPEQTQEALKVLLESPAQETALSCVLLDRGLTCLWSQWLRAYRRDGKGRTFPFAHPELSYLERCERAYQVLRELSQKNFKDPGVKKSVDKLLSILTPVCEAPEVLAHLTTYRQARSEFEKFRTALRTPHRRACTCEWTGSLEARLQQAKTFEQHLDNYLEQCEQRLQGRLSEERRRGLKIIVQDLKKRWSYLRGHVLVLGDDTTGRVVIVDRTNNVLESLIDTSKRDLRRRNGQKHVGRELQNLPADAVLTLNLRDDEYMETVYDGTGWQRLAEVFPTVHDLVRKRRDESSQVRLCDAQLGQKQQASHGIPGQLGAVYEEHLVEPNS